MADINVQETVDALRSELSKLKEQMENMVKNVENKKSAEVSDMVDKLTKELGRLRAGASERAQHLYDMGQTGVEEVGAHVRQNPVSSLLVAFGAGCVISCLLRHLGK